MAAVQPQHWHHGNGRTLILPSRVLAALDQLDEAEQAAVRRALDELRYLPPGEPAEPRLRRIAAEETVYTLRVAPQVLLFVRLDPDGPVEVVEIVRPETLRRMFPGDDPARSRP